MALSKGAKKLYDWLRQQTAGTIASYTDIMTITGWSDVSLKTYLRKNKVAPFLMDLGSERLRVLLDGEELSDRFFDETFTQTAPRRLTLSTNDRLEGANGTYELVEPLGNGAVGHVWSAKLGSDPSLVAAKIMLPRYDLIQESKLPNVRERFRREIRNGQSVANDNIVRYLDSGNIDKNPFLIMELADRSVAQHIHQSGPIPQEEAAEIVDCSLLGLASLHARGCPHRDVKPANLLEFSNTIKLGDLGIVKWSDFDPAFTKGGTITRQSIQLGSWFYMAPEQQESPHDAVEASDIYSLGVSWIEILTGRLPSPQAVGAHAYSLPGIPASVVDIIRKMCAYSPDARPSIAEIRATIESCYG